MSTSPFLHSNNNPNVANAGGDAEALHTRGSRSNDLHAFQAKLAEKIANAQASTYNVQSFLAMQVGVYSVHIPLVEMGTLLAMPEIDPVPLARQWLQGLAVVGANVVTVLDLAYCLNHFITAQLPDILLGTPALQLPKQQVSPVHNKLLMLNPLLHSQLAVCVDKVHGIVNEEALVNYAKHPKSDAVDGVVVKRIVVADNGLVFIEISVTELLKSSLFLELTY